MNPAVTPDSIEVELKIGLWSIDRSIIDYALRKHNIAFSNPKTHRSENIYYDTPSGVMHNAGVAIRVRAVAGSYEMTAKVKIADDGGISSRKEWNFPIHEPKLDFTKLLQVPLPDGLQAYLTANALKPAFQNQFDRTEWTLGVREAQITLAFDQGCVSNNMRKSPISELEFELVKGNVGTLIEVALDIADLIPSYMSVISKAERGERIIRKSNPMNDEPRASRLGLLNLISQALDPLSGPNYEVAAETLALIADKSVVDEFSDAIRNQRLPLGLTRWMVAKSLQWGS